MSGIEAAILAELVAQATASAISIIVRRASGGRRPDLVVTDPVITPDVGHLETALQGQLTADQTDGLYRFLASPEFRNVVYQLALVRAASSSSVEDVEAIRREFVALSGLYLSSSDDTTTTLFGAMLQSVDMGLKDIITSHGVAGTGIDTAATSFVLQAHLGSIARNVELITKNLSATVGIEGFIKTYAQQVSNRHKLVMPPNFGGSKRVPIDDLYVTPELESLDNEHDRQEPVELEEFVNSIGRTVVLGDPGGGKSTLSQKVCYDISTAATTGRALVVPILVVLRDYGAAKELRGGSILDFIRRMIQSTYQLDAPDGALEFLLLNGRALVIFDGLDELLDSSYRRQVTGDVESFCNLYPATSVLVTSRLIGYDEAPLDPALFGAYKLSQLDDGRVREYARKWFNLDEVMSVAEKREIVDCFMAESAVVADLRSNPLMLSLMCNIYRGENYIPANRPDVYEKCAVMLFERWDASRSIKYPVPFTSHLRPAMMHLAHAVYSSASLQTGVSRSRLEALTTSYLLAQRYDDELEAEAAARAFVAFCTGRAWVFTDVGTTPGGELLFQFTHRTFLEYFAAGYLVRRHASPETLLEVLRPHVIAAEWDVVAQLAVQMLNTNVEAAGEQILAALAMTADDREKANALSFCSRCLQFLVPSIRETRRIVSVITEATFEIIEAQGAPGSVARQQEQTSDVSLPITPLMRCAEENYPAIHAEVSELLRSAVVSEREGAGVLVWNFMSLVDRGSLAAARSGKEGWEATIDDIREVCSLQLRRLALRYVDQGVWAAHQGLVTLEELVDAHGLRALVFSPWSRVAIYWRFSLSDQICQALVWRPLENGRYERALRLAAQVGDLLLKPRLPLELIGAERYVAHMGVGGLSGLGGGTIRDDRAVEGAAICLALQVELGGSRQRTLSRFDAVHLGTMAFMREVVLSRIGGERCTVEGMRDMLRATPIRPHIVDTLAQWGGGELDFIDRPGQRIE